MPWIFFAHMLGTIMPLFLLPELVFKFAPFGPTMEGQYILKNIVFVAAGWTVLAPRFEVPKFSFARAHKQPSAEASVVPSALRSGA